MTSFKRLHSLTVAELRSWLSDLPEDAIAVIDDESAGFAVSVAEASGPWRIQTHPDGSLDYWDDDEKGRAAYREQWPDEQPFESLQQGVVFFRK